MTKGEQARLTAWRLKVLQQAADEGNVARVCRRFGISRKSFYKWGYAIGRERRSDPLERQLAR
jgi:transposase-like protein